MHLAVYLLVSEYQFDIESGLYSREVFTLLLDCKPWFVMALVAYMIM